VTPEGPRNHILSAKKYTISNPVAYLGFEIAGAHKKITGVS
jgi:hypothetical protein